MATSLPTRPHEKGIAQGGKMRVDTTVIETNITYTIPLTAPCWATGFAC